MDMQKWEVDAMKAMDDLRAALSNGPQSSNMHKIITEDLISLRLSLAFQTGNYEKWGL